MSKFEQMANEIVKNIGGKENIDAVTNCMTRLRFTLKDVNKANAKAIKSIKGVQSVVNKNGQFQVVIGTDVPEVCAAIKLLKKKHQ